MADYAFLVVGLINFAAEFPLIALGSHLGVVVVAAAASEHVAKHLPPAAGVFAVEQKNSHNLLSAQAPCQWPLVVFQ